MTRVVAFAITALLVSFGAFLVRGGDLPANAGGTTESIVYNVNGEVDIDLTLCCGTSETVELSGTMKVQPQPAQDGTIPIEIVELSLSGTSSLLGPNTEVTLARNENAGSPIQGQITPGEGIGQISIPFMDVFIGDFSHYLLQKVDMQGKVSAFPFEGGEKFSYEKLEGGGNPIQDVTVKGQEGIRGYLTYLNIDIKPPVTPTTTPPDEQRYEIIVLKQDADTLQGLPDWEINIYAGPNCDGTPFDFGFTDEEGILTFDGLEAGTYSVEEKPQPGWNPVGDECKDVQLPSASGVSGLPECPIQPNLPHPDPGCDEFFSLASVGVNFDNPALGSIECDLSGPTQVRRNPLAVVGNDAVPTELTAMDLEGQCAPGNIPVTVRESSTEASTGLIIEQQNDIPGVLEFPADSYFDVFFEVDTPLGTLHNQDPIRMECKIQEIPPSGCFYEPDVGVVDLYDADKNLVGTLKHARHIPIGPKNDLVIFTNEHKEETPTASPTGEPPTVTPTQTNTPTLGPQKTPQPQRTRHGTLRCLRSSPNQKVTGSVTVTEKKDDKPPMVVFTASCNSNNNPVVRGSYHISAGAAKNITLDVNVDSRTNNCHFGGYGATQRVTVSCTASPEGLYWVDTEFEAGDGDANKNGTVNSIDAALILQYTAGLTDQWPNSDVNGDGMFNAVDAALVLQFTAALVPALPV